MKVDEMESKDRQSLEKEEVIHGKTDKESWLHSIQSMKLSKEKREKIAILFLLGIFFLLLATPVSSMSNKKEKSATKGPEIANTSDDSMKIEQKDEYIAGLENKLEQTIGGMEGAGKVLVMITLKDSGEKILDKNQPYENSSEVRKEEGAEIQQSSIKSDQETVLVEVEGNTGPIVVQELYPDIEGVVVVCEGGDNSELSMRIKEAVQALFSIDAHKIVVCKLQQ